MALKKVFQAISSRDLKNWLYYESVQDRATVIEYPRNAARIRVIDVQRTIDFYWFAVYRPGYSRDFPAGASDNTFFSAGSGLLCEEFQTSS